MRLVHVFVVAVVASAAGCVHRSAAQPLGAWELRGTVLDANSARLLVRHKSGRTVDLVLDDRTAVVGHEGAAPFSALTHGRRVIVTVEPLADGRARAARVKLFGAG